MLIDRLSVRCQSSALFSSSHSGENARQSFFRRWKRLAAANGLTYVGVTEANRGCKPLPRGLSQAPGIDPRSDTLLNGALAS